MEAPLLQPPVPLPPNHDTTAAVVQPRPASGGVAGAREQCPRCASHDTKFCYYNNYNTAQPRHFCRACRRYWTLGGSLRNVPIGGSTRKRPRPARPSRAAVAAVGAFASPAPPQGGLLGSLISSASPLLALGAGPLLEGRLGFDLGLGLPGPAMDPAGAGEVGLGFGLRGPVAPFLWPTVLLENDHMDPWKVGGPAAVWQELSATAAPAEAGGLHLGAQLL